MADQAVMGRRQATRRGRWVYLDPEDVRNHPDYGVFGWALFLLGVLFIGPMILLWQDVEIYFGPYDRPENAWIMIAIDAILLLASWTACRLLGAERREFYSWYFITVVLAMCSLAAFISLCLFDVREVLPHGIREERGSGWSAIFGSVPSIVWWGIALRLLAILMSAVYVMQSRRLNITVAKRTSPDDPFVARAWSQSTTGRKIEPTYAGTRYPDEEEEAAAARAGAVAVTAPAARTAAESRIEPTVAGPTRVVEETTTTTTTTTVSSAAPADPPDDRRLRARLKQLEDARAAGLISDAEYEARRISLLNAT